MKRRKSFPKYVKHYRDPGSGRWINQYRRGGKTARLPDGPVINDEIWAAYSAIQTAFDAGEGVPAIGAARTQPGSIDAAVVACYRSTEFLLLAENSRRAFRLALERDVRPVIGSARLANLQPRHIAELIADKVAKSPGAARVLHAALRFFLRFCGTTGLLLRDPSFGIKAPKTKANNWHTWTDEQIAKFESAHPIGSEARLAEALHLYTGLRASDVVKLGRQYVRDGIIRIVAQKNREPVVIPIHPALQRVLDAVPLNNMTFLVNAKGGPITSDYNKRWRRWCDEAGLPKQCVPHGLRYAAITRLAEVGCSARQIMAITGHRTLSQVQKYSDKADRELLARQAMAALVAKTGTQIV
jgi:integrase